MYQGSSSFAEVTNLSLFVSQIRTTCEEFNTAMMALPSVREVDIISYCPASFAKQVPYWLKSFRKLDFVTIQFGLFEEQRLKFEEDIKDMMHEVKKNIGVVSGKLDLSHNGIYKIYHWRLWGWDRRLTLSWLCGMDWQATMDCAYIFRFLILYFPIFRQALAYSYALASIPKVDKTYLKPSKLGKS
jgi:hypothetical protein